MVFALVALLIPLGAVYLAGQITTLWVPRYLILLLPFFLLLASCGARALGRTAGSIALALLVTASLFALAGLYTGQQKEDWRSVVELISQQAGSQDLLVLMDEECRVPFDYYAQRDQLIETSPRVSGTDKSLGLSRLGIGRFADGADLDRAVRHIEEAVREGQAARVWLVVSHANSSGLEERLEGLPGLGQAERLDFVGIQVIVYDWTAPVAVS
jgi:hypothetical protein